MSEPAVRWEAQAREAIAARSRAFEAAFARGDIEALVAEYFVADAWGPMASPPGGQAPAIGRTALVEMFRAQLTSGARIRLETVALRVDGHIAHELGRAWLGQAPDVERVGCYAVCWLYRDQAWRVLVDFFAEDGWR